MFLAVIVVPEISDVALSEVTFNVLLNVKFVAVIFVALISVP